jgi:hypothetical protein
MWNNFVDGSRCEQSDLPPQSKIKRGSGFVPEQSSSSDVFQPPETLGNPFPRVRQSFRPPGKIVPQADSDHGAIWRALSFAASV